MAQTNCEIPGSIMYIFRLGYPYRVVNIGFDVAICHWKKPKILYNV
jgi:hypothetical protein